MLRYVMVRLKWKTALTILSGRVFQFHYSVFHMVDRLFVFKEDPNYEASLSLPNCGIAKNTLYDMRHMSLISICTIRFHNICRRNEFKVLTTGSSIHVLNVQIHLVGHDLSTKPHGG